MPTRTPPPRRPEDSTPARWAMVFAVVALAALVWPVYAIVGGIEPRILGVPFSLAYLVLVVGAVFTVMLGLFLWEDRNGRLG